MIGFARIKVTVVSIFAALGLAACNGGTSIPPSTQAIQRAGWVAEPASKKNACAQKPCIYVGNSTTQINSRIMAYGKMANGNVTPVWKLDGDNTGLNNVWGVAVDAGGNIYAANYSGNEAMGDLTVYASGSHGNVRPTATIDGPASGDVMSEPSDISVDAAGNIYASASGSNSISVYAPGAIYIANFGSGGGITVYAPGANGNATPIQTISGGKTGLYSPTGVAIDRKGNIYVSSCVLGSGSASSVTVYAKKANGNVAPRRTISGSNTELNGPNGIALDSDGDIYVTQYYSNSVTAYAKGVSGNVAPIRTISGSNTLLDGPAGITVH
jgi:hypothetical protein